MRPRERVMVHGVGALSDEELVAILVGSGTRGEDAIAVARRILSEVNGDLHALGRCDPLRLRAMRGIATAIKGRRDVRDIAPSHEHHRERDRHHTQKPHAPRPEDSLSDLAGGRSAFFFGAPRPRD